MPKRPKITFDVLRADMQTVADFIEHALDNIPQPDQRTDRALMSAVRMLRGATHIVIHEDKLPEE